MSHSSDFTIPLNVVTKIIAESLPEDSTVTVEQDFIKALARAAHLFILYSTTRANEVASENSRRTVHSQDVLNAIASLGFEHLISKLIRWHSTYVEEKEILKSKRKKIQEISVSSDQMEVEIITNDMNNDFESTQSQLIHDSQKDSEK